MADNLKPEQRRYCMSRVRGKDTSLEIAVRSALHRRGLRFRKNVSALPGRPDVVFPRYKVAVFIDGDFWHGYRLHYWADKLSPQWREKIEQTRRRDRANRTALRRMGWTVVRVWGHEVKRDLAACTDKISRAVRQ